MRTVTRSGRRFVPRVESLEKLQLLTSIAGFYGPMEMTNQGHLAWALPGMDFGAAVFLPSNQGYLGLSSVSYTLSNGVDNVIPKTQYNTNVGKATSGQLIHTTNYDNPDGTPNYGTMDNQTSFTAYKDVGNYTIDVSAVAWVQQGYYPTKVTLTDQLTLVVEAPQITSFYVEGKPARFNTMSLDNKNGTARIGVMTWQANNTPGFMFHATVTNQTHYDATVGFVQVWKPNRSGTYAGRSPLTYTSTTDMWDGTDSTATAVWYNNTENLGYWKVPKNQVNMSLSNSGYPFTFIDDSPAHGSGPQDNNGHLLRALSINDAFKTSVVVKGGALPPANGGNFLNGIPIALSTASWTVGGSGTTNVATAQAVMNPSNWNKSGLTPATAKNYNGDGVIKFLNWTGNGPAAVSNFYTQSNTGGSGGSMGGSGGAMSTEWLVRMAGLPSDQFTVATASSIGGSNPIESRGEVPLIDFRAKRWPVQASQIM